MKEPGNDELAQLFISVIGNEFTVEEASEKSELSIEKVAELISDQNSLKFFKKEGEDELKISCNYSWISKNLSKKMEEYGNALSGM